MEYINNEEQNIMRMPIGEEEVKKAFETLQKYKQGKTQLETRIIENEQWWKLKQREYIKEMGDQQLKPTSAWLFNCIITKHADAMDSYPEPNILPREKNDVQEAENLSHILPVVLQHNGFEKTYSACWWNKIKNGTGAYGIFWDSQKNGIGDIAIKKIDLLSLFWEPGIDDIQRSRNIFYVSLMDRDLLEERYPQTKGKEKGDSGIVSKYIYDDTVDTSGKALVVDWYYKRWNAEQNREILHFCKFTNDVVLFATENEPNKFPNGFYDHGKYPFELDVLFPVEGSPAGFGYVDIGKSPQKYIDLLDQAFLTNSLAGATPRHFVSEAAGVNVEDLMDVNKPVITVSAGANLGDLIMPMPTASLPGIYFSVMQSKIEELKETTGNRDVNNGGTSHGVTSGTAIAALQEQGGKLSRDMIATTYDCYERIVLMCIELIRQFYEQPRQFRILGENGRPEFVTYTNEGIKAQHQGTDFGFDMGYRLPIFDVEVSAQRENLYTKTAYNEFALQLYQNGFFNPDMATQALSALDIMDFEGKTDVAEKIKMNGDLQQMLLQWQQMALTLASKYEPEMAEGLAQNIMGGGMAMPTQSASTKDATLARGKESTRTANARQEAQERTRPR